MLRQRTQAHDVHADEAAPVPVQARGSTTLPPSTPPLGHHISGSPTFGMGVGVGAAMGIGGLGGLGSMGMAVGAMGMGPLSPSDFPPLRTVKPLPKRRRVLGVRGHGIQHHHGAPTAPVPDMPLPPLPTHPSPFSIRGRGAESGGAGVGDDEGRGRGDPVDEEELYGGMSASAMESIAGELMAHADSFAGQMALQNYYESVLGTAASASGVSVDMLRAAGLMPDSPNGHGLDGHGSPGGGRSAVNPEQVFDFTPYGRDGYIATPAYGQTAHGLTNYGTTTAYYPSLDAAGASAAESEGGAVPVRRVTSTIYRKEPTQMDRDEDGSGEDYLDHLQQPKNTKKRKVPANASFAAQGREAAPALLGAGIDEDDPSLLDAAAIAHSGFGGGSVVASGRPGQEAESGLALLSSAAYGVSTGMGVHGAGGKGRQPRLSAATLDGLRHKELVHQRKRQLSAVLDALSLGDTFALDQALSSHIPFSPASSVGGDSASIRVHVSKRPGPRMARATRALVDQQGAEADEGKDAIPPRGEFTFECSSTTSERLAATKEEVASLRARFEDELAMQSAKAAKAASDAKQQQAVTQASTTKGAKSKKGDKAGRTAPLQPAQAQIQTQAPASSVAPSLASTDLEPATALQQPKTKKTSKKKRRNALAIASNPHHRKNYVPSRLPSQGGAANAAQAAQNSANALAPLPLHFLSANLPPSRRSRKNAGGAVEGTADQPGAGGNTAQPIAKDKKAAAAAAGPQIVNPADEWICPLCEYALFFSDRAGPEYRRAVRGRKQILRRRRRAQERAAGGLSGSKGAGGANANAAAPVKPVDDGVDEEEEEDEYDEYDGEEYAEDVRRQEWKEAPDIGGGGHRKSARTGAG